MGKGVIIKWFLGWKIWKNAIRSQPPLPLQLSIKRVYVQIKLKYNSTYLINAVSGHKLCFWHFKIKIVKSSSWFVVDRLQFIFEIYWRFLGMSDGLLTFIKPPFSRTKFENIDLLTLHSTFGQCWLDFTFCAFLRTNVRASCLEFPCGDAIISFFPFSK